MQDEREPLGPAQINWLASIVADGTATPDEARELLREFVSQADAGNVSERMIRHMRDCVRAYLQGRKVLLPNSDAGRDKPIDVSIKSMEKAFGLTRVSRGQPRIDRDIHCAAAMEVLERLLTGETLEVASEVVAEDRRENGLPLSSDTQVSDAWAKYKQDALLWLRIARTRDVDLDGKGWTEQELARLCEIYADVPGIVLPGERAFEGRHALKGRDALPPGNSSKTPP